MKTSYAVAVALVSAAAAIGVVAFVMVPGFQSLGESKRDTRPVRSFVETWVESKSGCRYGKWDDGRTSVARRSDGTADCPDAPRATLEGLLAPRMTGCVKVSADSDAWLCIAERREIKPKT